MGKLEGSLSSGEGQDIARIWGRAMGQGGTQGADIAKGLPVMDLKVRRFGDVPGRR